MPSLALAFYFDLASPLAYLAAEQIPGALPGAVEWYPVLARELPKSRTFQFAKRAEQGAFRAEIVERSERLGLQQLRWPDPFPFDSELAMRAAMYAKSIGRTVPFAQAAFRQAFAGGRSLDQIENVLIASAACEMHPAAVLAGVELRAVRDRLSASTALAARRGVQDVPAIAVSDALAKGPGHLFIGEHAVDDVRAYLFERAMPATLTRSR